MYMLKLCMVAKVKVLFLLLVYVFNFNLFEFSAAILEKGLYHMALKAFSNKCRKIKTKVIIPSQSQQKDKAR